AALPKPPATIDPTAVVAAHAVLVGTHPIRIGRGAVVHPYARLVSTHGPVDVGDGCIVGERAAIGLGEPGAAASAGAADARVALGRNTVVETGAVVEARETGEGAVVEAGARAGPGSVMEAHSKLAPTVRLPAGVRLPAYTVVYGPAPDQRRVDTTLRGSNTVQALRDQAHARQLELLRKLIPSNIAKW
ncbi:hypothetical protein BDY21DRAFT_276607, partial [Lineolata rhizophorae]